MKNTLYMAWQHLRFFKARSTILVLGLTLTIALPIASHLIISKYGAALRSRADSTPYVLGARGNRFDLVLKSLYFGDADLDAISLEDVNQVVRSKWATAMALHLGHTAKRVPIVGAPSDYFAFRELSAMQGTAELDLGDVVAGSAAAEELNLSVGDRILSDRKKLYDLAGTNPVNLIVVGILKPSGSADDRVLFSNLDTTWLLDGLMHGHPNSEHAGDEDPHRQGVAYHEVTAENRSSFHLHAFPAETPISAAIVLPKDQKGATILEARYENSETLQLQNCSLVIEEILAMVVQVQTFFDTYYVFVLVATLLFVGLIVALSTQLRRAELNTMRQIGASRWYTIRLQTTELMIIVAMAGMLSMAVTWVGLKVAGQYFAMG
ncbi:MAG: permease [Phycisphaerae bacterium]|nr:MAG: permease [Phycisphaerae bacterium]